MDPDVARQIEEAAAMLADNRPEEAIGALRRVADAHPEAPEARLVLAGALAGMEQPEAALAELDRALAEAPDHPMALYMKATALVEQDDLPCALEMLQRAVAAAPDDALIASKLADVQALDDDLDAAWETIRRAVKIDRKLPLVWYTMAKIAFDRGDTKEAEKAAKQATKLDPDNVDAHVLLGWTYLASGRWKDAASSLQRATTVDPEDATAQAGLGLALAQMKKPDQALVALDLAMQLEPEDAGAFVMAGQAYLLLERWEDARNALEQAVAFDPDDIVAHALLTQIAFHMGDGRRALQAYARLKELEPDLAKELGEELGLNRVTQPATRRKRTVQAPAGDPAQTVYQLKVTLKGSKPPIWRRILVTGDTKLSTLHNILQIAMGWGDEHLHQFTVGGTQYSDPAARLEGAQNERRVSLASLNLGEGSRLTYEYDFGDSWGHTIQVEKVLPREEGQRYPVTTAGKRSAPPEDSGGIWGYADLVESLKDPESPDHDDVVEWVGEGFDPERFDMDQVNQALQRLR